MNISSLFTCQYQQQDENQRFNAKELQTPTTNSVQIDPNHLFGIFDSYSLNNISDDNSNSATDFNFLGYPFASNETAPSESSIKETRPASKQQQPSSREFQTVTTEELYAQWASVSSSPMSHMTQSSWIAATRTTLTTTSSKQSMMSRSRPWFQGFWMCNQRTARLAY